MTTKNYGSNGNTIRKFNTWTSWVDYCENRSDKNASSHDESSYHREWTGGLSFAESIALARKGWGEKRPQVEAILNPIREKLAEVLDFKMERSWDMFGYEPDIDRFLLGEMECMFEDAPVPAPASGRAMTMIVDTVVTGNVPAAEIFKRGAAIVALVETLSILGYELEVWGDMSVRSWGTRRSWTGLVKIHDSGTAIDMNKIMFAIGHPATLRRLCFGAMEAEDQNTRQAFGFKMGGGYGSPCGIVDTAEMLGASFTVSWGNKQAQQAITDPVQWVLGQLELQGLYDPEDGATKAY